MKNKLFLSLCVALCAGLAISTYATERVVVCEEAYSET
jgi:hypothetical protein